jgi:hypothetical protein
MTADAARTTLADEIAQRLAAIQCSVVATSVSSLTLLGQLIQRGQPGLFTQDIVLVTAEHFTNDFAPAGMSAIGDLIGDKAPLMLCQAEV